MPSNESGATCNKHPLIFIEHWNYPFLLSVHF
jgi:hypothetical protein